MRTILALLIVASTAVAQAQTAQAPTAQAPKDQAPTKAAPQQGPPPKNLTKYADGHVSANPEPTDVDKFEVHIVKQGETLSQIAGAALKDQRMWPLLWEQNEHIINPHWIYPNDKILVRPVTPLAEAKPPESPAAEPGPPEPQPEQVPPPRPVAQAPRTAPPVPRPTVFIADQRPPAPEIKYWDLYCSGFVRKASLPLNLKVIARYDATGAVLASETDYIYLSQGSKAGIIAGDTYQVIRPTRKLTNLGGHAAAFHDLGMHYIDVAQIRVVVSQPDFSLARVVQSCGDAVEVDDLVIPFEKINLPPVPRPRPFSPTIKANGPTKGVIVAAKSVLMNFGSTIETTGIIAGVHNDVHLGYTDYGLAETGSIVYIDVGQDQNVKPGDLFLVYRTPDLDHRLFPNPPEVEKIEHVYSAVGEVMVVKTGERAATAVVTYATDALYLGDEVELR